MFNRFYLAPLAVAVSAAFLGLAAAPSTAATPDACTTTASQLRVAASTAAPDVARKALSSVKVGEALCGDNRFEANRKFSAAAKTLGVDLASLGTPVTTAAAAN